MREIGVVNAAGPQAQHFGRQQGGDSHRARRADDEFRKPLALDVIEHLEDGREAQFLELVFGQLKLADWREVFDRDVADLEGGAGGHHHQLAPLGDAGRREFANRVCHAVDVLQGVGKPRPLRVAQAGREFAAQLPTRFAQPWPVRGLAAERVKIRAERAQDRRQNAQLLDGLNEVARRGLLHKPREKPERKLVGEKVGDDKRPALGFLDSLRFLRQQRFDVLLRKMAGKLPPQRHVRRLGQLENFARRDALRQKTQLLRP